MERGAGDADVSTPEDGEEYMQFEPEVFPADRETKTACAPMPTSWQEYQFLQRQLEKVESAPSATEKEVEEATQHVHKMQENYLRFKTILAEG